MRLAASLLAVFAAVAGAQTRTDADYTREQAVTRLTADLANLKNFHWDDHLSLARECTGRRSGSLQRPEECGPFDRVEDDFSLVSNRISGGALAFNLVVALSGRELKPGVLSILTNSLVDAVVIVNRSERTRTPISGSVALRDSVMRAYAALVALGVEENRVDFILSGFLRSAEKSSRPPDVVPIPPAHP